MLNYNENKVTLNIFIPNNIDFFTFMPNYLSFSRVVFFILALFIPPGSGTVQYQFQRFLIVLISARFS
jgi:hypothetical protein